MKPVRLEHVDQKTQRKTVVATSIPSEITDLKNQGFKEVKPQQPKPVKKND